jgi:hypothetical protein
MHKHTQGSGRVLVLLRVDLIVSQSVVCAQRAVCVYVIKRPVPEQQQEKRATYTKVLVYIYKSVYKRQDSLLAFCVTAREKDLATTTRRRRSLQSKAFYMQRLH